MFGSKKIGPSLDSTTQHARIIVLGSGPAGCTAAIYAARANLKPLLFTGDEVGGQLLNTNQVDNWPGDAAGVQGPDLMLRMREHVERLEATIKSDRIVSVDLKVRPFQVEGREGKYSCDALIIATGATARYLGVPSEKEFIGRGISSCAVCDGIFFRNQDVIIVGGGSTAVEEAMLMSQIANNVTIVHRRDRFRAEGILVTRLEERIAAGKVRVLWNHIVEKVLGDRSGLTGAQVRDLHTNRIVDLKAQGMFVAIGHRPNTDMFRDQLEMDADHIVTGLSGKLNCTATSVPGVFAAGDVQDSVYRQAVTSAASGCMAALDTDRYLQGLV